jgi:hypothetical protein
MSRHLVASSDCYFIQILCGNVFRMKRTRSGKPLTYQERLCGSHRNDFFLKRILSAHSLLRTFIRHFVFQRKVPDIRSYIQDLLHNENYGRTQLNTIYISCCIWISVTTNTTRKLYWLSFKSGNNTNEHQDSSIKDHIWN